MGQTYITKKLKEPQLKFVMPLMDSVGVYFYSYEKYKQNYPKKTQ